MFVVRSITSEQQLQLGFTSVTLNSTADKGKSVHTKNNVFLLHLLRYIQQIQLWQNFWTFWTHFHTE